MDADETFDGLGEHIQDVKRRARMDALEDAAKVAALSGRCTCEPHPHERGPIIRGIGNHPPHESACPQSIVKAIRALKGAAGR
jgi:hypothetical protein